MSEPVFVEACPFCPDGRILREPQGDGFGAIDRCDTCGASAPVTERSKPPLVMGSGDFSIGSTFWPGVGKLIEESGEVLGVCGKLIGSRGVLEHWDGSNLKERLEDELGDVLAATDYALMHNPTLDLSRVMHRRLEKLAAFERWHNRPHGNDVEQQRCGVCGGLADPDVGCLRCQKGAT